LRGRMPSSLLIAGMLVQWATIATVAMALVLAVMYYRLARKEESEMIAQFGDEQLEYMARTPAFIPLGRGGEGYQKRC